MGGRTVERPVRAPYRIDPATRNPLYRIRAANSSIPFA